MHCLDARFGMTKDDHARYIYDLTDDLFFSPFSARSLGPGHLYLLGLMDARYKGFMYIYFLTFSFIIVRNGRTTLAIGGEEPSV